VQSFSEYFGAHRQLFEVDAPVYDLPSEDEDEDGLIRPPHGDVEEAEGSDGEEDEDEDESDDESVASSSTSSSSRGPHAQATSTSSTKKEKRQAENGNGEPTIEFPDDLDDVLPEERAQARGSKAVWSDPSDSAVRIDIEANRLLKKLGRGKGDPNINGTELEKRLREQCVQHSGSGSRADSQIRDAAPPAGMGVEPGIGGNTVVAGFAVVDQIVHRYEAVQATPVFQSQPQARAQCEPPKPDGEQTGSEGRGQGCRGCRLAPEPTGRSHGCLRRRPTCPLLQRASPRRV